MNISKKNVASILKVAFFVFLLSSCLSENDDLTPRGSEPEFLYSYDFSNGIGDWQTGFVEYPLSAEDSMNLDVDVIASPSNLSVGDSLLRLSAFDPVGDLFSYILLKVTGLTPNADYAVLVETEFLAVNLDSLGTTYSSDQEIHVKAGVFDAEPLVVAAQDTTNTGYEYNILDIDKGNGLESGTDMETLGTLRMPEPQIFTSLLRANNNGNELQSKSDADGNMWLLIGTDSDAKMKQGFYYSRVAVIYDEL